MERRLDEEVNPKRFASDWTSPDQHTRLDRVSVVHRGYRPWQSSCNEHGHAQFCLAGREATAVSETGTLPPPRTSAWTPAAPSAALTPMTSWFADCAETEFL